MNLPDYLLCVVCRFILFAFGWNAGHDSIEHLVDDNNNSDNNDVVIGVITHTSYWDYAIAVLLVFARGQRKRVGFIIWEGIRDHKYFRYVRPLFDMTNVCWAPSIKSKNARGTVRAVAEQVRQKKIRIMLIAPTGTTDVSSSARWFTGWFALACELEASIMGCGLDYSPQFRCPRAFEPVHQCKKTDTVEETMPEVRRKLEADHAKISPRNEMYSAIDFVTLTSVISMVGCVLMTPALVEDLPQKIQLLYFTCSIFAFVVSCLYHHSYEHHSVFRELDRVSSVVLVASTIAIYLYQWVWFDVFLQMTIVLPTTAWFYKHGVPRHAEFLRTRRYELYHSLFHLMGPVSVAVHLLAR